MKRKKLATICAASLLFPLLGVVPASASTLDGQTVLRGIDVSIYQGDIDFVAVRDSGVRVVYIRAGIGGEEDDNFRRNYEGAKDAKLSYGFYYYVTARTEDEAKEQADHFARLLEGKTFNVRPAMDFESFGDLTKTEINAIAFAFLAELERLTEIVPVFYSSSYDAVSLWNRGFSRFPLWVADYGAGTRPDTGIWETWAGYQYTDEGVVNGIEGPVDLNYFKPEILLYTTEKPGLYRPENPHVTRYVVRPGDTLRSIARRFGVSLAALIEANNIRDPNLIYVGEILRIPTEEETERFTLYTVKPGDNLWNLSRKYGVSVSTLAELNGIRNPNLIYVGEVLRIPIS